LWFETNQAKDQEDTAKTPTVCNNYAIEKYLENATSPRQTAWQNHPKNGVWMD